MSRRRDIKELDRQISRMERFVAALPGRPARCAAVYTPPPGSDYVVPAAGHYTGAPMRRRVGHDNTVKIDDVRSAWPWSGGRAYVTPHGMGH